MNASCKAFYFQTSLGHYCTGMPLRIRFSYDPAAAVDLEELGEVVRVDRQPGSFGVAVAICTPTRAQLVADRESGGDIGGPVQERRSHQRSSMVAAIDLMDLGTGALSRGRISDLSLSGCYIDTLNPLPLGTSLDLWIQKGNEVLEARASVCTQHYGLGMGLKFDDLTRTQSSILSNWLIEGGLKWARRRKLDAGEGETVRTFASELVQNQRGE